MIEAPGCLYMKFDLPALINEDFGEFFRFPGKIMPYTPVISHSWLENPAFEDVFPIQDGDFPASYVCLPEGSYSWRG